jgi:hypothetical protein
LSEPALQHATLVYRLAGEPAAHVKRILEIPEAARVLRDHDRSKLHATGWLEDAVAFMSTEQVRK